MSSFMGPDANVNVGNLRADDIRLWNQYDGYVDIFYHILPTEPFHHQGYTTGWWPGTGGLDASGNEWLIPEWQLLPAMYSGAVSKMAFIGISQDQYGTATAACTMKLFKTADGGYTGTKDTKLDEVISDSSGNFILYTPYHPDTHYITLVKDGSPSIQGISINTLIGA